MPWVRTQRVPIAGAFVALAERPAVPARIAKAVKHEREATAIVAQALRVLAGGVLTARLIAALRAGDADAVVEAAMAASVTFRMTMQTLTAPIVDAIATAGDASLKALLGIGFDLTDANSLAWAQSSSANLVVEIDAGTRQAIRDITARAIRDGLHPYDAADLIENVVGLHSQYATAVYNYREGLLAQGFSDDRMSQLVGDYYDRLLGLRAETIARTEILSANNAGKAIGWMQAIDGGFLAPDATKTWLAAADERTCPICGDLDGTSIGIDESWDAGDEIVDMPPAHPNCRCTAFVEASTPSGDTVTDTSAAEAELAAEE